MSRPVAQPAQMNIAPESASEAPHAAPAAPELCRRVVFECNATGSQLANGVVVGVDNARAVFKPSLAADATAEEKAAYEEADFSKGIVTNVTLKSVASSCPEPVTVGMNLFDGESKLQNSEGWLYARETNDMSTNHAHQNDGFTNLVTVLPHERQRPNEVVYQPHNVMDSHYIQKYGSYTMDKLKEGIVPFPGEQYVYVPQDHVVCDIIRNNWDQLGIDIQSESAREGKFIKVSKTIVDSCIQQLNDNVLSQIPYTGFNKIGARFQANTEGSATYKVVCEMLVKYKFP